MKALGHPNVAQPFHSLVLKIPRSLHTMSASLSPLGGESAPNSDLSVLFGLTVRRARGPAFGNSRISLPGITVERGGTLPEMG